MLLSEEYFKEFKKQQEEIKSSSSRITNFNNLYLTTKDQQAFYESLGYKSIEPILCYTVKEESRNSHIMKNLFKNMSVTNNISQIQTISKQNTQSEFSVSSLVSAPPPPPPPPPPPLPMTSFSIENSEKKKCPNILQNQIFWYKKLIKHDHAS